MNRLSRQPNKYLINRFLHNHRSNLNYRLWMMKVTEAVSIPIISEEEMVQIIRRLIDLGYLAEPVSHQDFQAAISDFQRDNSLPATGKLDGPTRELLRDK